MEAAVSNPPLREYQRKCVDAAIDENLLVVLPTNSGKTRIAAEVLGHFLNQSSAARGTAGSTRKRWCVLLTPTGPLADQQGRVLVQNCVLEPVQRTQDVEDSDEEAQKADAEGLFRLGVVRGQQGAREKTRLTSRNAWRLCDVLVMTPALLVDSLVHAYVNINDIALLVLDEAHQLKGLSEYAILMERFYSPLATDCRPRVMALTASPLSGRRPNCKAWEPASEEDMQQELEDLERKVDCRTWTELGLVEASLTAAAVEERQYEHSTCDVASMLLDIMRSVVQDIDPRREWVQRWKAAWTRLQDVSKELGLWATLQALQLYCGQQDELDPFEDEAEEGEEPEVTDAQATVTSEEERAQLLEAKRSLNTKLQRWILQNEQSEQRQHSPKLRACITKLKESAQADSGDLKCLIFTRTRICCQLLALCLHDEPGLPGGVDFVVGTNSNMSAGSTFRIRQTANFQKHALRSFAQPNGEDGALSILVATSVLAEGIDVPSCGLVLCFDPAATPLQHVQLRGRARRKDSQLTVLVPRPGGPKSPGAGPSLKELQDYEVKMLETLRKWSTRRPVARAEPAAEDPDKVLVVPATGARLPIERAKRHLHNIVYGQSISGDDKTGESREQLDFCRPPFRDDQERHGYSMFEVVPSAGGYHCELELPPVGCCSKTLEEQLEAARALHRDWWQKAQNPISEEHLGLVIGPVCVKKDMAKKAAALRACTALHGMGILNDFLKVAGRQEYYDLIRAASGRGQGKKTAGKKRSDDAIALRRYEILVRELPRCLRVPSETAADISMHVHRLAVGDHEGEKIGLAMLLPEEVPTGAWNFLLLPPGLAEPVMAEVKPIGCTISLTSQQQNDLKVWTQICLEISRCDRSCPLHQSFAQPLLTHFKDRSGRWVPATNAEVVEDKDLPDRSFWLLAPLRALDAEQEVAWDFLSWALGAIRHFQQSSAWLPMPTTWLGEPDPSIPAELALRDAVVLGPMPSGSRGSDVKCLCIDLEAKAVDGSCTFTGFKFSRAAVNAAIAPDFTKVDRNLQQERLEIFFKAEECELMPLTSSHLHVLRFLPSLLWRLEFVALMQEMPQSCGNLLQTARPPALGEAMTHSQVLSLPFGPPWTRRFCYERMELMGDAVLKLMSCAHAAAALPKAREGELSSVAQWCETNKWLRKVNEKTIRVGSFLLLQSFRPKIPLPKLRQNRVPQKVAADAVEAALGAVFGCAARAAYAPGPGMISLNGGMDASWRIFRVLAESGPTAKANKSIQAAFETPLCQSFKDAAMSGLSSLQEEKLGSTDANAVEQVEKAFGYRFRNPRLLAAVRASPTGARPVWFERLEFLGDAVLLVAVCCHILQEYPDFDEGSLSETLHAFICNRHLARKLVRRFGQVQNLAAVFFPGQASPLRRQLPRFVKEVIESEVETDYVIGQKSSGLAAAAASTCMQRILEFLQQEVPQAGLPGHFKFVADSYEALIAAVLLDTGGDLDETWAVFAKDFEVPRDRVQTQIRAWHDHLRQMEKEEVVESGALLPKSANSKREQKAKPDFGHRPAGEPRKRLVEYCKRHGVKLRFEQAGGEEVADVRTRCVVAGRSFSEAAGASLSQAQDLAAEMALWELTRPKVLTRPPRKVETKPDPASDAKFPPQPLPQWLSQPQPTAEALQDLALQRPKGVARQELQKLCGRSGLQLRYVEAEEEDESNTTSYRVRAKVGDRTFPEGSAITKGAAQDMAAELALRELGGPRPPPQTAESVEGEASTGREPKDFEHRLRDLPAAARQKGVDRQELQSLCQSTKMTLTFQEQVTGPSHRPTFRACAVVQGTVYPEASGETKNAAKDLAAAYALHCLK